MFKDDSPYLDSSFSFHTEDTSPLESPRLTDNRKLSTLSGQPSQNQISSASTLSRKPTKSNTLLPPQQTKKFLLPPSRDGSTFKPGGNLVTPVSRGSKMSRRSIFQEKATPRSSKVLKVLPVCSIGEQGLVVEDKDADKNKEQVKPARQKGRDLNKMSMEELLDLAVRILKKDPAKRNMKELQALSKCVSQVNFFKECDQDTALKCLRHMSYEKFKTNQSVFEINTMGTTFWVILRGSVGVWVYVKKVIGTDANGDNITEDVLTEVKILPPGSSFGELALLDNGKKRSATIVCKEECEFAVLEKAHFVDILKEKETRKLYNEVDFLVSLPLLQTWSYNAVKLLYYNTTIKKYKRGHVFYEEGDVPQTMYIVRSGELKVLKQVGVKEEKKSKDSLEKPKGPSLKRTLEMGIISEKGIIGEEELLTDSRRKYKVVCHSLEVEVCEISKSVFLERILKFVQTKEWLTNYVSTRENYYDTRLKYMNENSSSLAYLSSSPKLQGSSSRTLKEGSQSMRNTSIGEGPKDNTTPVKQIPSSFLRGMPKKPTRRISPECRLVHTEPDVPSSESPSGVPKLNIPIGNQAINDYYNADKEQQNNERLLSEQMDLRTYETPIWRQVKKENTKTTGIRDKKKQMTWSPRSPEFDVPLSSFREEFERLKKKVNGDPSKSARNEADKETPLFYFKIEQNVKTIVPTEESEHNQTVVVQSNVDTKQSLTNDYAGYDYGLERKSVKTSSTRPQTAKPVPPKLTKRVPKLPMALQSWGGIRDASVLFYNHTITENSDISQSSRTTIDRETRPVNQHTFFNRAKQTETLKHHTPSRTKQKTETELCIQGVMASLANVANASVVQTERSSIRKFRPSFVHKKSAVKNLSTSVEGKQYTEAKSLTLHRGESTRYTLNLPKSGNMGFI